LTNIQLPLFVFSCPEGYAGGGLPEREPEVLDVARSVVAVVNRLLRQDEVVLLDDVEDGDDGLARLVELGELVEAVVRDAVVPGKDGHSDAAPAAARGEGGGSGCAGQRRWWRGATAAVAAAAWGVGRWRCGSRAHAVEGEAYRSRP
jgi:hypothetical protein